MRSTITYKRGQVVVVNVPFSNHSGVKPRPSLIVSAESFHRNLPDLIVCPISSQPWYYEKPVSGDVPLRQWRRIGLRYPSTVRVSKLLSVDKEIVKTILGSLSPQDFTRVEKVLRKALGL